MADTKLSALTELAVEPADTDEIYVNDGGTSKRITYGTLKTALLARANHTGTQTASTISDFASAVAATASVTANTAKISADDPALISALAEVTAEGSDYAVILDTSVSPNALKKILISDLLDNATHTGDATGSGALTLQPAAITGKGAVTVAGGDLLLVADVSASPQVLGQVTASSVAALATPEGTAILSTGETGGTKYLREDGDGTCSWQAVAAGTGDLKADGTVPLTANWDVGSFDITAEQFHSDIATGTAPFTVASTTVVANLNADLLDGNEASAFAAAAHSHEGTAILSTGPVTDGYVLTADGAGGAAWEAAAGGVDWSTTQTSNLSAATGDEVAFDLSSTVNKATSGNYTGIKLNVTETAAPGSDDRLINLQVGGSSKFYVDNVGHAVLDGTNTFGGNILDIKYAGSSKFSVAFNGTTTSTGQVIATSFASSSIIGFLSINSDTILVRDGAAATLALRNSTNAQTFRVYTTYTDASNYERLSVTGSAITVETAGTGTDDIDLTLTPAGAGVVKFGTHSALSGESVTGYITIKDSGGTTRKIAVVS